MAGFRVLGVLCAAVVALAAAQATYAKGTPLKGYVVGAHAIGSWTGDCSCETQWFTFGAKPGKVTIRATMRQPGDELSQQWGIRVVAFKGNQILTTKNTVCFVGRKGCANTVRVVLNIRRRGVYYFRVDGDGAHQIPFVARVSGSIVSLLCNVKKSCSA